MPVATWYWTHAISGEPTIVGMNQIMSASPRFTTNSAVTSAMKLFFGADPAQLAAARLAAHRRQLAAYEARLAAANDAPEGPRLTLHAGIAHEREWVRFWKGLAG